MRSRYLGRGQIAVCMRSGIKCHASELVRDGRIPSLLVLPEWADPPQPQERPYVPNDMEGTPRFDVSPDVTPVIPPVLTAEVPPDSPSTPVLSIEQSLSELAAVLTWTASEPGDGDSIEAYTVWRSENGGDFELYIVIDPPALTYTDTGITEDGTYEYYVVATAVAGGDSDDSNTVGFPLSPVDLFVFIGTSNMRSLAAGTPPANVTGPMAGAQIWNTTTSSWQTYEATVNSDTFNATSAWGPEAEFARQYLIDTPAQTIYMVKIGVNNSLLNFPSVSPNWNPSGGDLFDDMSTQVAAAKAALIAAGYTPIVRAFMVDLGWNDAKLVGDAAAFTVNLEAFLTAARAQWGNSSATFFLNRIQSAVTLPFSEDIRDDQVAVAESTPLVEWFDTDYYPVDTVIGVSPHYLGTAVVALGYDYFHSYAGDYPALSELPNPTFSNVIFLAGLDGADGATTYTEESNAARVATFVGNAQLDTAASEVVYGTACALFDGTGDEITFPDSPDFTLGSGPFVMEFTFKFNSLTATAALINQWTTAGNQKSFAVDYNNSTHRLNFSYSTNGSTTVTPTPAEFFASVSTPTRLMIERDAANDLRVFQNGILIGKVNIGAASFFNSTSVFKLGGLTGFAAFSMNGMLDEIRIVKGQALHGSDARFLPRTTLFPRS